MTAFLKSLASSPLSSRSNRSSGHSSGLGSFRGASPPPDLRLQRPTGRNTPDVGTPQSLSPQEQTPPSLSPVGERPPDASTVRVSREAMARRPSPADDMLQSALHQTSPEMPPRLLMRSGLQVGEHAADVPPDSGRRSGRNRHGSVTGATPATAPAPAPAPAPPPPPSPAPGPVVPAAPVPAAAALPVAAPAQGSAQSSTEGLPQATQAPAQASAQAPETPSTQSPPQEKPNDAAKEEFRPFAVAPTGTRSRLARSHRSASDLEETAAALSQVMSYRFRAGSEIEAMGVAGTASLPGVSKSSANSILATALAQAQGMSSALGGTVASDGVPAFETPAEPPPRKKVDVVPHTKSPQVEAVLRGAIDACSAFDDLSPSLKQLAVDAFEPMRVGFGEAALHPSMYHTHFYVVASGKLCTTSDRVDETQETVIDELRRGDYFGEAALHRPPDAEPFECKAYTIECASRGGADVYRLHSDTFHEIKRRLLDEHTAETSAAFLAASQLLVASPAFLQPPAVEAQGADAGYPDNDDDLRGCTAEAEEQGAAAAVAAGLSLKLGAPIMFTSCVRLTEYAFEHQGSLLIKAGEVRVTLKRNDDRLASKAVVFKRGDFLPTETAQGWADGRVYAELTTEHLECLAVPADAEPSLPQPFAREIQEQYVRKVLSAADPFLGFAPYELQSMLQAGQPMTFNAGEPIFKEGQAAGYACLFIVLQGTARAYRAKNEKERAKEIQILEASRHAPPVAGTPLVGRRRRPSDIDASASVSSETVLGYFDVGDHFGASTILEGDSTRSITIEAQTTLRTIALPRDAFGGLLERVQLSLRRQLVHRQWLIQRGNIELHDLAKGDLIGTGTFGRVRMGTHPSGKPFAVKMIDKKKLQASSGLVESTVNERSLLATCNHPFLLRLVSAYQSNNHLFFITEVVLGGELYSHLQEKKKFPLPQARFYAACVVSAFAYLAKVSVVYRDLKPENLLIEADGYLKVIDFGFAKIVDGRTFTFCGTPDYMAPEILKFHAQALPVDWWALGVLIYEMLVGQTPFVHDNVVELYSAILAYDKGGRISFPWFFPNDAKSAIEALVVPSPEKRLSAAQMTRHSFFAEIDFLQLEAKGVAAPFVPSISHAFDTSNFEDIDEEEEESDEEEAVASRSRSFINRLPNTGQFPGFIYTPGWSKPADVSDVEHFLSS